MIRRKSHESSVSHWRVRFHLEFVYGYPTSSRTIGGVVKILEFNNDLAVSEDPFPTEVGAASDSDKAQVEKDLVSQIQAELRKCISEYETQVESKAGKFRGQLPPSAQ